MSRAIRVDKVSYYETKLDSFIKELQSRTEELMLAQDRQKPSRKFLSVSSVTSARSTVIDSPFGYRVTLSLSKAFSVTFNEDDHRVKIEFSDNWNRLEDEIKCVKTAAWYFGIAMLRYTEKPQKGVDLSSPLRVPARISIRVKNSIGALLEENLESIKQAADACATYGIDQTVSISSPVRAASFAMITMSRENESIRFNTTVRCMGFRFQTEMLYRRAKQDLALKDFVWELADSLWENTITYVSETLIDAAKHNGQRVQKEREEKAKEAKAKVDHCSAHSDPSTLSEITAE